MCGAKGAGIGAVLGALLAPVTGGLSLAASAAIGGAVGGVAGKKLIDDPKSKVKRMQAESVGQLSQQQNAIAEEVKKKRIARKPIQTVLGGAQTPTEGVTLGS